MDKTSPSHRAQSPENALLGFLTLQPNHGYNLHRLLITELGENWHVSQSQTYNILKRLEAQGLIYSTTVKQEKLPDIQYLKISPSGRRRFKTWLEATTGNSARSIRLEFITRLYFAQKIMPEKIQNMLDTQSTEVKSMIAWLESSLADLPNEQIFNRLSLQLRIQQLRSIVEWLEKCWKAF
jgi:PadR family transcriptional regulator, regulatory protein AphA